MADQPTAEQQPNDGKPLNYDLEAHALRTALKAKGILLMVVEGERGSGLSVQLTKEIADAVPGMLRKMANKMERDIAFSRARGRG